MSMHFIGPWLLRNRGQNILGHSINCRIALSINSLHPYLALFQAHYHESLCSWKTLTISPHHWDVDENYGGEINRFLYSWKLRTVHWYTCRVWNCLHKYSSLICLSPLFVPNPVRDLCFMESSSTILYKTSPKKAVKKKNIYISDNMLNHKHFG